MFSIFEIALQNANFEIVNVVIICVEMQWQRKKLFHNCDSANVVYLIHCNKCPEALYIGETGGNFRYSFNNHTHSFRQKKLLPLPLHFNADDHNINDLKVCILKGNFKDTKHRKLTELQFIIDFETNKFGFNKDISFLSKYDTFKH